MNLKSRRAVTRTQAIILAVVVVVAVVVGVYYGMQALKPSEAKHVVFQLEWVITGTHLPFFVAQEKFWPELGLDVTLVRGVGSGDTVRKVAMGIADFGWATFDVGAQLRASESMLIRSICDPYTKNINGLFYIKGRDAGRGVIDLKTDIKTLEGKIYGDTAWSSIRLQLPAFAELADVDVNTINQQTMDTSALLPALIAGTIDAFGCTAENGPYYAQEVAKYDLTGEYILFVNYGLVMLSYTLWTTDKMIVKDPDLVAKVVEGLQKGFKFTCENLDDAVEIFISANPEWTGKNDAAKGEWLSGASAAMDKAATDAHGLGWHDDGMVKQSVEAVYVIYDISEEWQLPSYKDIYTNDFIDTSIHPETWPW